MSSIRALMMVQLRPPNTATARCRAPGGGPTRGGERGQEELARRVDPVLGAEEQHDDGPQAPDGEADVLGEHQ